MINRQTDRRTDRRSSSSDTFTNLVPRQLVNTNNHAAAKCNAPALKIERERDRVVCCCSAARTCFGSEGAKQNGDGEKRKQAGQHKPSLYLAILAMYSQKCYIKNEEELKSCVL